MVLQIASSVSKVCGGRPYKRDWSSDAAETAVLPAMWLEASVRGASGCLRTARGTSFRARVQSVVPGTAFPGRWGVLPSRGVGFRVCSWLYGDHWASGQKPGRIVSPTLSRRTLPRRQLRTCCGSRGRSRHKYEGLGHANVMGAWRRRGPMAVTCARRPFEYSTEGA